MGSYTAFLRRFMFQGCKGSCKEFISGAFCSGFVGFRVVLGSVKELQGGIEHRATMPKFCVLIDTERELVDIEW